MPTTSTTDDNDDHESTAVGEKAEEALSALHDGDLDEAAELLEEIATADTSKTEQSTPKTGTRTLSNVLNSFDTVPTPVERFIEDLDGELAELPLVAAGSGPAFVTNDRTLLLANANDLELDGIEAEKINDKPTEVSRDDLNWCLEGQNVTCYLSRELVQDVSECFDSEPKFRIWDTQRHDTAYPVKLQFSSSDWIVIAAPRIGPL